MHNAVERDLTPLEAAAAGAVGTARNSLAGCAGGAAAGGDVGTVSRERARGGVMRDCRVQGKRAATALSTVWQKKLRGLDAAQAASKSDGAPPSPIYLPPAGMLSDGVLKWPAHIALDGLEDALEKLTYTSVVLSGARAWTRRAQRVSVCRRAACAHPCARPCPPRDRRLHQECEAATTCWRVLCEGSCGTARESGQRRARPARVRGAKTGPSSGSSWTTPASRALSAGACSCSEAAHLTR